MQEAEAHRGSDDAARESRIRARGPVLDLHFAQSMYKPLLKDQRRDGVEVSRDTAYGNDSRHRLDIYTPVHNGVAAPHPVMIFIPGGGFIRGDKADRENIGQRFAREGIAVVVANYRLAPAHVWPAGAEDVTRVYQWVRDNATRLGFDSARILLAGESAGAAHIAAATLIRRFHPPQGFDVAGTILISGPYNPVLEKLAREQFGVATPDPRNEAYFGSDFARYPQMSTVALIDAPPTAPLLITFAELDLLQMQVQGAELFAKLVTEHGAKPELRVIRGHNHLTQVYSVNTGDESLSAPMLEFLRECLSRHQGN
jgi:acetyl esterase/lipase